MAPTGDVTITGLLPGAVTLEELDLGYYGTPGGYDGDLFDAGDPIRVTSAGGATTAISPSPASSRATSTSRAAASASSPACAA